MQNYSRMSLEKGGQKYLDRCIKSILGQDYRNIEVLLIDDGSTDNSGDICDKYSVDIRVKVIHQKNGGVSRARNTGLKNISGEYVAFIDFIRGDIQCQCLTARRWMSFFVP